VSNLCQDDEAQQPTFFAMTDEPKSAFPLKPTRSPSPDSLSCRDSYGTIAGVTEGEAFWRGLDELVAACRLVIDRPRGTAHPRYPSFVYPLDYGYLQGTQVADGDGIDVWVGSLPERKVTAVVCTVDADKRDAEVKILLGCTPQEACAILAVHNRGSQAGLLVERPEPQCLARN
jgi:inorganic pyrophosphatase